MAHPETLADEQEKEYTEQTQALAKFLDISLDEAELKIYNMDYEVYTDEEADDKREDSLDNYLEECVYPELPGQFRNYFDDDARKRDARYDGRGHSLATYDGHENEETINGTTYYIYRMN